jgi:hypothetical protein
VALIGYGNSAVDAGTAPSHPPAPGGPTWPCGRCVGDFRWHVGHDCESRGDLPRLTVWRVRESMRDGRRTRLRRNELRTLLLQEGRSLLHEEGFGSGPGNLTFKRVFDRLELTSGIRLTNASVIKRVWPNLADYQADVLVAMAEEMQMPEAAGAVLAIGSLIPTLDLSTPETRALAVRTLCRIGGGANTVALSNSDVWSLWVNLLAMATEPSGPGPRQRVMTAFKVGHQNVDDFWSATYASLMKAVGLRLRDPWTVRQFTMAVTALSEGCSLRNRVDERVEVFVRPTGPDGEDEEWTLFSIGLEGLVNHFLEPDPAFEAPPT